MRETRLTSLEIRDIERRLQRLNVIQAWPRFHLLTPQKTKKIKVFLCK